MSLASWLKKIVVPPKYRKYLWIAAAGLVLYGGVRYLAVRPIQDKVLAAQIKQAQADADYKAKTKEIRAAIAALQKDIVAKDKQLAAKDKDLARKDTEIGKVDVKLADLEAKYKLLTDCPSQLGNMTEQKDQWKGKFSLCDGKVADLGDKVILWTGKFNDEVGIAKANKDGWDGSLKTVAARDESIKQLNREISRRKLWGNVKTGVIIAAVGYVAYNLIKK